MQLTATENRVAEYIAKGMYETEIAEKMFVSPKTIHNHAYNIRKKWNARNAVDICRMYIIQNPKRFITAMVFMVIQTHIIYNCADMDLRRSPRASKTVRISRNRREVA